MYTFEQSRATGHHNAHIHVGPLSGSEFKQVTDAAYAETVHWRRNLFKVPSGKEGKAFIAKMARLYRSYAETSTLESVALKAAMIMPLLLLQSHLQSHR